MNHLNDALSEVPSRAHGAREKAPLDKPKHIGRRVVQLVTPVHVPGVNLWFNDTCLIALCDDGTTWALRSGSWQPLAGPPGTEGGGA